jgi:hypothetical protein
MVAGKYKQVCCVYEIQKSMWKREQTNDWQVNAKFYQDYLWEVW